MLLGTWQRIEKEEGTFLSEGWQERRNSRFSN